MHSVVIADDEPYILNGLEKKLPWLEYGMEIVGKAHNGLECLEIVRREHPDFVITDIRMPGLTGLELIEKLVKTDHHPVVVFMSGYSEFEYARKAIELGALSYLLKPIGRKELRSTVLRVAQELKRREKYSRLREARTDNDLVEFLSNIPAGIDPGVVTKRLGFRTNREEFVFLITDRHVEPSDIVLHLKELAEIVHVMIDGRLVLYIANFDTAAQSGVIRTLERISASHQVSAGISTVSNRVAAFPRLLRQAKVAYHSEFVTGKKAAVVYRHDPTPVLTAIMTDFERHLSLGNETQLRRLLDQLPGLCIEARPPVDELLGFYNTFLTGANRLLFVDGRHDAARSLVPDLDTLVMKFASVRQLANELEELLTEVFGSNGNEDRPGTGTPNTVASVKQFIKNNLDSDLSAEGLAVHFNTDRAEMQVRFKEECGSTLAEYVRGLRIDHACFLLSHTRLTIQEIAQMCGYDDYFYFARLFRNARGMSATEFRNLDNDTR